MRVRPRRWKKNIPHLFTLGNAFFGFCALAVASGGDAATAAHLIFMGTLFDLIDGRLARRLGLESSLGTQLDSLCDAITFCAAPAFLVYTASLVSYGFVGLLVCGMFLLSALLRLARFNIGTAGGGDYFRGIPTTMAGGLLASCILNAPLGLSESTFTLVMVGLTALLTILMHCPMRFPKAKKRLRILEKRWQVLTLVVIGFAVLVSLRLDGVILLFFFLYLLLALGAAFLRLLS